MDARHMQTSYKQDLSQSKSLPFYYFLLDLAIYISVMFLIREVYFSQLNFITNGLFWSLTSLTVAFTLMRLRGVAWRDIGLCLPKSMKKAAMATVFIFVFSLVSIIIFELLKEQLALNLAQDQSDHQATAKFGYLKDNWGMFLLIIPFVWIQSAFEELLDRGFLINWIERALSNNWLATVIAVITQALIFGFRHSYDISERSITVALIGLAMGIGYVAFGRNLWPLIIAHCVLNTISMVGRV